MRPYRFRHALFGLHFQSEPFLQALNLGIVGGGISVAASHPITLVIPHGPLAVLLRTP